MVSGSTALWSSPFTLPAFGLKEFLPVGTDRSVRADVAVERLPHDPQFVSGLPIAAIASRSFAAVIL
jgi:hypothetical protein